jgi:hypothetical protein
LRVRPHDVSCPYLPLRKAILQRAAVGNRGCDPGRGGGGALRSRLHTTGGLPQHPIRGKQPRTRSFGKASDVPSAVAYRSLMAVPTLDFRALDDVAFAAERGKLDNIPATYRLRAGRIGPLLELLHLQRSGLLPSDPHWLEVGDLTDLRAAIIAGRAAWAAEGATRVSMMKLAPLAMSNEWTVFAMEARRVAVFAGFDISWAGQLIAAIRELENNIRDHSGAVESAYIAIRASLGIFEFVVADAGKGVLETLREAADFVNLTSDGDALRATLSEGVSRFGVNKGRGFGYAPLFTGLVNRRATLRFRSGCGSLVMDGVTPALPSAQIGVKPRCSGLFISVCCFAS